MLCPDTLLPIIFVFMGMRFASPINQQRLPHPSGGMSTRSGRFLEGIISCGRGRPAGFPPVCACLV